MKHVQGALVALFTLTAWTAEADAQRIITVQPRATGVLCPNHTGWGDVDFYGNGPEAEFSATLIVDRDRRRLIARLNMWARETRPDHTTAEGSRDFVVWTAPPGVSLLEVVSARSEFLSYVDEGHERDLLPGRGLVRTWQLTGDTNGDDLEGRCTNARTSVQALFNLVRLRVEDVAPGCPRRLVQAHLRNPGPFCPVWVESGDGDFFGNGPLVRVQSRLDVTDDARDLELTVAWTAEENPWRGEFRRRNWFGVIYTPPSTTVHGFHSGVPVWTAPAGCRIHEVRTRTFARSGYIDDDYGVDRVLGRDGGAFVHSFDIVGDTDGEDIPEEPLACRPGEHHSVQVNFYPVTVLLGP